jgi:hypothetical protein
LVSHTATLKYLMPKKGNEKGIISFLIIPFNLVNLSSTPAPPA